MSSRYKWRNRTEPAQEDILREYIVGMCLERKIWAEVIREYARIEPAEKNPAKDFTLLQVLVAVASTIALTASFAWAVLR